MEVTVVKILRRGKKSVRILLSTGETVVSSIEELPQIGDVYSSMTSEDSSTTLRLLRPTDPYPSMIKF